MMSTYKMEKSRLKNGRIVFENQNGLANAIKNGFFLLKIPENIDLRFGDLFAQNFYKEKNGEGLDLYKGYSKYVEKNLAKNEGYYLREKDQTEQFFLEQRFWAEIFPFQLALLARQLKNISIQVLHAILSELDIPENIWLKATGGCTHNQGMYHLTFNHFRPEVKCRGLNVHKDSGWVTILRSIEPGLEAFIGDEWAAINPESGYFIVNFGCAIEILTENTDKPVSAIIHRVNQQTPKPVDRYSYAMFADSSLDPAKFGGLYQLQKDKSIKHKMDFDTFLDKILKATYEENSVGLY